MKCIEFEYEKDKIKEFLKLPTKIYSSKNNTEDKKEVEKLLKGEHALSKYFSLFKFLIYKDDKVVGRFCITTYPKDKVAYLGFFECINDKEVAKFLFDNAYEFCKKKKFKTIVGPVDASFWVKYRLKINEFTNGVYTAEPYNREYYYNLFLDNGYEVIHHYISNIYKPVEDKYFNVKYTDRYNDFTSSGYTIKSPNMADFEKIMTEFYYLLTSLYKDFPIYKHLSLEDFLEIFNNYKKILNESMVKFAYFENKMVGFHISIPNYYNYVYHLNNPLNILKILKLRKKPKCYIMLYMGVDPKHKGLGKALAQSLMLELKKSGLPSIGALVKDGKETQNYVSDLIEKQYEYVLLKKDI